MKTLIILSKAEYVRNYLDTNAFADIEDNNCFYIAPEDIGLRDQLEKKQNFAGFFKFNHKSLKWYPRLFDLFMWRYRKRSSAFYFRFYRLRFYLPKSTPFRKLKMIVRGLKNLKLILMGSKLLANFTIPCLEYLAKFNQDLFSKISDITPDLVIFPSSAYDPIGCDIIKISQKLRFKTLFLIDNWDNLSSKTVFWKSPDFLTVWGEQSREHAFEIQGINKEKIFTIGTPRFQRYYDKEELESPFRFLYILFCGCFLGFDELSALKLIDKEITENETIFHDVKVVYRPHPWRAPRECDDVFQQDKFENIILDPQLKDAYCRKISSFQPDLNYYPALLKHASLVVCPLTTMLIEALICGTKVLALRYDDGIHITSPHNAYKYYPHFKGIEKIEGLSLCDNKSDLREKLQENYLTCKPLDKEKVYTSLQYFIYHDSLLYSERLKKVVSSINNA